MSTIDSVPDPSVAPPEATSGRAVMSGGAWSIVGRTLPLAYTFVVSVFAARILGPSLTGRLALITFASASVTVLLTTSLAFGAIRSIGEALGRGDVGAVRNLVPWLWRVFVSQAALALVIFAGFAALADTSRAAWLFAGAWSATTLLHSAPSLLLAGAQRWRDSMIVGVSTGVVHVVASILVLLAGGGITQLIAIDAAIGLVNILGTSFLARRYLRRLPDTGPARSDLRRPIATYAIGTVPAVALSYVIERRSELFFLALFATSAQIAIYSIPFSALAVIALVPSAIGVVTTTAFASLIGAGAFDRVAGAHARAVRLTVLASLPVTAAALAVGPRVLELVYGSRYAGTGTVLLVLVAALPLIVMTSLELALLQGLGRIRDQVVVYGAAAAVNVAACLVFIPRYHAVGAAIAHSSAYVVAASVAMWRARRASGARGRPQGLHWYARPLAASALGGGAAGAVVLLVGGGLGAIAALATGAVVFALLARLLRILRWEDATWLAGHFGGAPGRAALAVARPPLARTPA
jgi:O-antigen/teichoic acid export membrane protein